MAEKLLMMALSPTMEEGKIINWNISEGEKFSEGDVLCEVETDKAAMEYESVSSGVLLKIVAETGASVKVGDLIAISGEAGEDITDLLEESASSSGKNRAENPPLEDNPSTEVITPVMENKLSSENLSERIRISPLARKIAEKNNISLAGIRGSGPAGRIIKRDLQQRKTTETVQQGLPVMNYSTGSKDEIIDISQKRSIIAERLSQSKYTAPHYYLSVDVMVDDLIKSRRELNSELKDKKVSLNSFLIKLSAEAIKKNPLINSSWQGKNIIKHGEVNIGLAVAQEDGLITPIIRDTLSMGILDIDHQLTALVEKSRTGKLSPEEYTGATFTISNLGSYGIDSFTAIINPPGSAILAVGKSKKTAVVIDDEVVIRTVMNITLSCDHRIIDGAVGAKFLKDLKDMMENPIKALY